MGTTTRFGLRHPVLTDAPNGPQQLRNLAEDVDGWLSRAFPCLSTARPTGIGDGFLIRETDTGRLYVWNATAATPAWERLALLADVPAGSGGGGGGTGAPSASATYTATTTQNAADETDVVVAFNSAVTTDVLVTRASYGAGHKFVLNETGIWVITSTTRFAEASGGGRTFEIRTVAGTVLAKSGQGVGEFIEAPWTANLAVVRKLASGTEIYVHGRQDSGGTLAIEHGGGSYCHIDLALVA